MKKTIISALCLLIFTTTVSAQIRMSEGARKMATTMAVVEAFYVDKVDDKKLAEDAIKSLLDKLDPHSTYLSVEEVKEMNEPLEGNFDGIGISFNMLTDTLYVIETIPGGPSEKIGLRAGDKILYVNDTLIAGVKRANKDIMSRLKGPKGTSVNIKIQRRGVPELLSFKIIRDKIPIYSIEAAYLIDKQTGYIRLSRFGATTVEEFKKASQKLKNEGMENLILDLQYNGGGYLTAAIELSDEFLGKDKLIVYTEGSRQPKREEIATSKGFFEKGKLVVLINEGSASASEIVAGAIQDWDRGVIVGRRSFGKGLVQRPIPLPDESMIRLTIARYYTPTGRCIQKPYKSGDLGAYNKDVIKRYNSGEMMHADSIHFPDSLKYTTLINHRTVYGGGGIMPDYYVPMDTTEYSGYFGKIADKSLIQKLAYNEVDNHRNTILSKYPKAYDFYKHFNVSDELLENLKNMAAQEKIEYDDEGFNKSKEIIMMQIKTFIARDVYDAETSVRTMNDYNDIFKKGYEIIQNEKLYKSLLN